MIRWWLPVPAQVCQCDNAFVAPCILHNADWCYGGAVSGHNWPPFLFLHNGGVTGVTGVTVCTACTMGGTCTAICSRTPLPMQGTKQPRRGARGVTAVPPRRTRRRWAVTDATPTVRATAATRPRLDSVPASWDEVDSLQFQGTCPKEQDEQRVQRRQRDKKRTA
ncbi:hypothetical protein BGZ61DRAFT_19588 [Ilyonectria robusta]|uniref:uncharacterized protein n=1 Tax=Ilyonectria robusta TaxID=1079257 RepID=UPI001E8ED04C|nr:uncharacterized protein BGZ61DRAFT_19588 [Ilyonectria robusta]KAH8737634.1 hypothetical protein BGZ61DRAFT_19588 [Ilyonectria robusta]